MSLSKHFRSANCLLSQMTEADYALLQPYLDHKILGRGHTIARPNEPVHDLWFPESGLVSQIASTSQNRRLEVGIFGREGSGPVSSILGVDRAPYEVVVQMESCGYHLKTENLRIALENSVTLRALLTRYVHAFIVQIGFNALSNHSGLIGERLARWLLMCHDRVQNDDLKLTHGFLGEMLGVRRSGVTDAIHQLESTNIIRATRGNIRVLDRARLEETAGESYGIFEREYGRLIIPL